MSTNSMETSLKAFNGMQTLPVVKQLFLLLGLSASIALAAYIVLWSQAKDYLPIGTEAGHKNASETISILERENIHFKLDQNTGLVLVAASDIHMARMKLAKEGISREGSEGLELLDKQNGLTTSQFVERARYIRGLQGELERTISQIQTVRKVRVHLAIPKQSSFTRLKKAGSASIFVDVGGGMKLTQAQIHGIMNLVASSVQGMSPEQVTVIDQYGSLLSAQNSGELGVATKQLEYKSQLEDLYSSRIYELLSPILGDGRIRAEVTAEIDFTSFEKTYENYNPEKSVVRSEQTLNVEKGADELNGGIPGALSNIPPNDTKVPEKAEEKKDGAEAVVKALTNSRSQATRNFEIDRVVGRESKTPGKLMKLSVAVLVDDKLTFDKDGKPIKKPVSEDELKKLTQLVKEAVGFQQDRGDAVTVINAAFAEQAPIEALPPIPFYQQDWFPTLIKQALAGLFALIVLLVVIRPMVRNLSTISVFEREERKRIVELQKQEAMLQAGLDPAQLDLNRVKSMINDDPKRIAQVVKSMVTADHD